MIVLVGTLYKDRNPTPINLRRKEIYLFIKQDVQNIGFRYSWIHASDKVTMCLSGLSSSSSSSPALFFSLCFPPSLMALGSLMFLWS